MAIKRKITEANGVVTEYHRIVFLKMEVNARNTILVHSYLSADGRQIEKDYAAGKYNDLEEGMMNFPYVAAKYITFDYDENMTLSKAYEQLKMRPEFEGSEDI